MSCSEGLSKDLPTDIIVEILSRLPLKSFNRFKAVSKSWLALSSDPCYSKKFRKFQLAGLFCKLDDTRGHKSSETHFASLSEGGPLLNADMTNLPHQKDCDLELLDCCNGLLLFRCQTVDPPCFYISNPFTKKWNPILTPSTYHGRFALAYDPSISSHFQVLFFEISKRDNSIVSLAVMSTEAGQWKQIRVVWPESENLINAEHGGNILLDGTMYLLLRRKILAMVLEGWSCYTIWLPETSTDNHRIAKCKGMLQFISSTNSMIQIWTLRLQSEEKWILKYKLDIQKSFGAYFHSMFIYPRPILIHPYHDVLFLFCWKDENTRTIVSYDLCNSEMEEICNLQNIFEKGTFYYTPSFSDCLSTSISALK